MDSKPDTLRPGGYAAIDDDNTDQQALSVDMLDETNSWGTTQALKAEIASQMHLTPESSILDAGCGTGDDCLELRNLVPDGTVVGVDTSKIMISEAVARAGNNDSNVSFQVADVHDLPFDDGNFDSCRSEQTFHWLVNPMLALTELLRVTRSGGRIVVADTDYSGVFSVTADAELNQKVIWSSVTQMIPNPLIARRLPVMFAEAGIGDIQVIPMFIGTNSQTTGLREEVVTDISSFAVESGQVTKSEADQWAQLAWESHHNKTYWYGGLVFVVAGTRP